MSPLLTWILLAPLLIAVAGVVLLVMVLKHLQYDDFEK